LTAYTKVADTRQQLTEVEIYYRINTSSWSGTPVHMTLYDASNYIYTYDFTDIPGFCCDDYIYFYVVGYRNDTGYDNWGLWPQYYEHPPVTPSGFSTFDDGIISYCHLHS